MSKKAFYCVMLVCALGIIALAAFELTSEHPEPLYYYVKAQMAQANAEPAVATEARPAEVSYLEMFTDDDVDMIARILYNEARHLPTVEQSMVVWCMLNSWEVEGYGRSFAEVVQNKFTYNPYNEIEADKKWVAQDVLTRYVRECKGEPEVGRTLPKGYIYMVGDEWQTHNIFRKDFDGMGGYFRVDDVTNSPY